jgi:predicted NUDIX family NTP pyrophosphohydrolase
MPSAGLLPFRFRDGQLEVLIAHPGGPFWQHRQEGAWSIVKGAIAPGEDPINAAMREFKEETGWAIAVDRVIPLGEITQRAGKRVLAWAIEADFDPAALASEPTTIHWKGRDFTFGEIDEVRWCGKAEVERLLNPAQVTFYYRLADLS